MERLLKIRRKKKRKKNYIDKEIVKNNSDPEVLKQRLYPIQLYDCRPT